MALTYGTTGINKKDFRVYMATADTAGLATLIATYEATQNSTNVAAVLASMEEVGECRMDSIDLEIAEGDSVMGNGYGKISISKTGTLAFELINTTIANINSLEEYDKEIVSIFLVERDARTNSEDATEMKVHIMINDVIASYSEKTTGGSNVIATISVEKSVARATSLRMINDIDVQ